VGALAAALVLYVGLELLDFDPDPLRLTLLVLASLAVLALFLDAFGGEEESWGVESQTWTPQPGQDLAFASYVRVIESHLTVDVPDHALRDRLAAVADLRLERRYAVRLGDPRAAELLGPELTAVLTGPPRRLSRAEIDRCVTRIEEL
jgi:hypothetical protein